MKTLDIVMAEDDFQFVVKVEMLLDKIGLALQKRFDSAEEAIPYIRSNPPDLILLDIHLQGKLTGTELANVVNDLGISFILFSADPSKEHYINLTGANLIAYIVKPFDDLTLRSAIEVVRKKFDQKQDRIEMLSESRDDLIFEDSFFIRKNKHLHKVVTNDIMWVYSEGNYCFIVTEKKKHVIKVSLTKVSAKLPPKLFVRVHRSYLVMESRIDNIDYANNRLYIEENEIPIGRTYKAGLVNRLNLMG